MDIVLNAVPCGRRAAKQADILASGIACTHAAGSDPAIPPGSEISRMDTGLCQLADDAAESQQMLSIASRGQRSPPLQKSSGSDQGSDPVAFQNGLLNDFVVESVLNHAPGALIIVCLVLQAKEEASRADHAFVGTGILTVEVRVEVAVVPRSPL